MHRMWRKFTNRYLAVCLAKDAICAFCNFKGHFTNKCKSRRKNVNNVNNPQNVDTEVLHPSDQPPVNHQVHEECCDVINV